MSRTVSDLLTRHRYTVDEYHRMGQAGVLSQDARVELIEGEIIDMTPIGSRHAATVKRLSHALMQAVGNTAIVSVQDPVVLDDRSEPQPDLALLNPRDDFYAGAHPTAMDVLLIIEVADASLLYDREVKLPLYARHRIPEVWLVDLENNMLLIHREPQDERYTEITQSDSLADVILPKPLNASVDLAKLF
jgi:Uma2 family endonuclease